MKRLTILLGLLLSQIAALAGLEADIPKRNQVILKSGAWTPSAAQTQETLVSVESFLQKEVAIDNVQRLKIRQILLHSKEFRVQFVGVVRAGKKLVSCNFFPAATAERDDHPYWKREWVSVEDGGFWFWQISFDPETEKSSAFTVNGEA
ncbi:MAG: hypothetical protein JWM68_1318 [Verrucomicrobiales bacterium]|nr:hypothetical protein [Verrucomicrobiales bacterium]